MHRLRVRTVIFLTIAVYFLYVSLVASLSYGMRRSIHRQFEDLLTKNLAIISESLMLRESVTQLEVVIEEYLTTGTTTWLQKKNEVMLEVEQYADSISSRVADTHQAAAFAEMYASLEIYIAHAHEWIQQRRDETLSESAIAEIVAGPQQTESILSLLHEISQEFVLELEQFAATASHDLQAPLRAVSGFVLLLKNRYGERLDEQGHEYLEFVLTSTEQMQMLVHELLTFAKVGSAPLSKEPVDCNDILATVRKYLQSLIAESDASLHLPHLPVINADRTQILLLFQNLLENAIKYRGNKTPEISVEASRHEDNWLFRICDNGIGIPTDQQLNIFDVFKRLHSESEYSGTGLGLATCKRIVERHGGHIWIDSTPGVGTTVNFTIPENFKNL